MKPSLPAGPVLALDTSVSACAVCLWQSGAVRAQAVRDMTHGHAEALAPLVRDVLAQAGVAVADLAAVAVTRGPGGFTGIRVGLAFARGLGLAAGCPVRGATTTAVLARMALVGTVDDDRPVAVVMDARRAAVYLQVFDARGAALGAPESLVPAMARDALAALPGRGVRITGDGAALLPAPLADGMDILPDAATPPNPAVLAALVASGDPATEDRPRPLYVRPPDATLPPPNARARS